jgi:hypothetical protein
LFVFLSFLYVHLKTKTLQWEVKVYFSVSLRNNDKHAFRLCSELCSHVNTNIETIWLFTILTWLEFILMDITYSQKGKVIPPEYRRLGGPRPRSRRRG